MSERDVRIHLSVGLVVVAVIHAVLLACVFSVVSTEHARQQTIDVDTVPSLRPDRQIGDLRAESVQLPPVNVSARDEIKEQAACPTCVPAVVPTSNRWLPVASIGAAEAQKWANHYKANLVTMRLANGALTDLTVYARLPQGYLWVATGASVTKSYSGRNAYVALIDDMRLGVTSSVGPTPAPMLPAVQPVPTQPSTPRAPTLVPAVNGPAQSRYQLALFVGNDAKSQEIMSWFERDPELVALKQRVDFQIYTAQNALYRARYADQVPVEQFPALLFCKPDGGHIHAAGANMLPRTAAELLSDMQASFELAKSAAPQPTGLIRETGYSWDAAISPQMRLQSEDCPDGWCPTPERPRVVDRLFDNAGGNAREALFGGWLSLGELVAVLAIAMAGFLAAMLILVAALKRR